MFFFNSCLFSICFHFIHSCLWFLFFSKNIHVGWNNALEIWVKGKKNSWLEEDLEQVVFLLEFLILLLRNAIADEDIFSLVDPDVVNNIPKSTKSDRNQYEHNRCVEVASGAHIILDEPVNKEGWCQVEWDQKNDGNTWEPPGNLVVEDKEEVPRDVVEA